MTRRHPNVLEAQTACLLVVDVQERFRQVMGGFDALVQGCVRLTRAFNILGLPVVVTEQYPKGLGHTVDELREVLGNVEAIEKSTFSSCGCAEVPERIAELGARQILLCGIEAHVCVNQTVHDLLHRELSVHLAVDAVASRKTSDRDVALRKMEGAGAILTSVEMAAFELLVDSKHPRFKEVQALFK